MQQVMEISAVDEEIRRLQAKRSVLAAGVADPSTSTPNPNLSGPQSANSNPFVQPFASTLPLPVLQPWTMPGYATLPQIPLFGVPGGQLRQAPTLRWEYRIRWRQPQCRNPQFNYFLEMVPTVLEGS